MNVHSGHTDVTSESEIVVVDELHPENFDTQPTTRLSVEFQTFKAELQEARESIDAGVKLEDVREEVKLSLHQDYHLVSPAELLCRLGTDIELGLSSETVTQVSKIYGPNVVTPPRRWFWAILKFIAHFFSGFALLLWGASILCFIAWKPLGNPNPDINNLILAIILIVIVFIQAVFEIYQERTSSRIMSSISSMLPSAVRVVRDGEITSVKMSELVPGDIVHLGLGDKIAADMRILSSNGMKIDGSTLTGESDPVNCTDACTDKNLLESKNVAFLGTSVVEGSGVGVVVNTGSKTVMGSITKSASKSKQANAPSALNKEIRRFVIVVSTLAIATGVLCVIVWAAWLRRKYPKFLTPSAIVVTAIGAVVAYVPEGLPVCVTMTLTLIAKRMGRQKVLVKSLMTIETLGCVNVICSDKTGTLTLNKMSVSHLYVGQKLKTQGKDITANSVSTDPVMRESRLIMAVCNRAYFEEESKEAADTSAERAVQGDASDTAMLRFSEEFGSVSELRYDYEKLCELPFNSKNKFMITVCSQPTDPRAVVMMKGAAEIIANRCATILDCNGNEIPLTDSIRDDLTRQQEYFGECGERVLALSRIYLDETEYPIGSYEFSADTLNFPTENMCLVGLVALSDKPRPEAAQAVTQCRKAGIRVAMVTGDHPTTAGSIARMVNIVSDQYTKFDMSTFDPRDMNIKKSTNIATITDQALIVTGSDISLLTKPAWEYILSHEELVFARTTPEQKLRIVKEFQKRANVVAVTGDGVNDSPALRNADVGISMAAGSDVAREAADIILMDNNFASVVVGIQYGRLVFENLKKVIAYVLPAGTFDEMLTILSTVFFGLPTPLSSILMISISVFTDVANCLTLIFEQPEADLMTYKPRSVTGEKLVNLRLFLQSYIFVGVTQAVGAFGMWFWFMYQFGGMRVKDLVFVFDKWTDGYKGKTQSELNTLTTQAQSVFFIALIMEQFGNLLLTRTRRLSFFQHVPWAKKSRNQWLPVGMFVSVCLGIMIVNIPAFNYVFKTKPIPYKYYFAPLAIGFVVFFMDEVRKFLTRKWPKAFFFSW